MHGRLPGPSGLGTSPPDEALSRGVRHMLDRGLGEFLLVGRPAHSYAQLRYLYSAWLGRRRLLGRGRVRGDQHRGLGAGRALMRAVESHARELGCVQLQLDANERNEIAVALYESEGYSAPGATWDGGAVSLLPPRAPACRHDTPQRRSPDLNRAAPLTRRAPLGGLRG